MRSFRAKVNALEAWHAKLVDKPWLQPLKPTKFIIAIILLSTVIAAGMNWYVRHWQYQVWEQNPAIFYLDDGTPLFTTTDAPYFLGMAKAIKDENDFQVFNEKRRYPNAFLSDTEAPDPSLRDVPLLAYLLSFVAENSSQKALLEAGHLIILINAVLTAIMIIFAFGAAGYWISGAIAAAGGGLSFSYLSRSGAGRIDTDQLNLGFFYLMTGLVIVASKAKNDFQAYVLTAITGIVFWVYSWWYFQSSFGWAFLIGLIWFTFISTQSLKRTSFQATIFLLMSGLIFQEFGLSAESAYFSDTLNHEGLIFPNTFETITELRKVELSEILTRTSGSSWFGTLSLFGLLIWGLRHPAVAVVFGPAAFFALLNFSIGNRAIFYTAPMLWFGFGWSLITIARCISNKITRQRASHFIIFCSSMAGFFTVWLMSPTSYVQGPSFDKHVVEVFRDVDKLTPLDDPVVITWWDYGYMSMFMNQMPTLHDGGSQTSPSTYFIANSLLSNSQQRSAARLQQLKTSGGQGAMDEFLGKGDSSKSYLADRPLYLVLTKDMADWISSISKIGNWDISSGKAKKLSGVPSNYRLIYENLNCQPGGQANEFLCNNIVINTATGQFGAQAILDGMVVSRDGRQLSGQKFNNSTSALMLHSEIGDRGKRNMLIHRDLYFSVFHQLFHAGRYDEEYFELIYDGYPNIRIFNVK